MRHRTLFDVTNFRALAHLLATTLELNPQRATTLHVVAVFVAIVGVTAVWHGRMDEPESFDSVPAAAEAQAAGLGA